MGRFDNYVDNKLAIEQEEINKKVAERNEQERLEEERENLYIPIIKKALLELNDVFPKINKWETHDEEITKSILGMKRIKSESREVIPLYTYDDGFSKCGWWIGKNGRYYKTGRGNYNTGWPILAETNIDEIAKRIYKELPWGYVLKDWCGSVYQDIGDLMKAGNAEEAVFQFIEKIALERNV